MSHSLYNKTKKASAGGINSFKSEHDDIWDDTLLIKYYEESIHLQKEEVAKRIAMKTNKKQPQKSDESMEGEGSSSAAESEELKVGDFVRNTFEDGVDYEAEIISMDENDLCLIRYIGYGNEETVKLENLVASWGDEVREQQIIQAEIDQQQQGSNGQETAQGNFQNFMLNKSQGFQNASLPIPPMPPLPPGIFDNTQESELISAMLMSWYMSGYYTGLYHGQKHAQQKPEATSTTKQGRPTKAESTSSAASEERRMKKARRAENNFK